MIICLACRHASPDGSLYCGYCTRSLNCRVCEAHSHKNAMSVRACTQCGSLDLTEGARGISTRTLSGMLAGLLALAVWKIAVYPHLTTILRAAFITAEWFAAVLTNSSVPCVQAFLTRLLSMVLTWWLIGWVLSIFPGKGGKLGEWLRALPVTLMRHSGRTLIALVKATGRLLRRLIWPHAAKGDSANANVKGKHP